MRVACLWFSKPAPVRELADYFLRLSPQMAVREERALFIEIGKCHRLYSEESFMARASVILRKTSQKAQISLGNDLTEALTLAKFAKLRKDELPLVSLVDFIDPFNKDEVLKKSAYRMVDAFSDLGIRTIGDFKKIPLGNLIERFGVIGRLAYLRVMGEDFVAWPLWRPKEIITEKSEFPHFEFYGELEPILFELKGHLDRIFSRLYNRKKRAMALRLEIQCEKFSTTLSPKRVLDFEFFAPQGETKGTLRVLKERLSREFEKNPISSAILNMQTTVLKTVEFEGGQRNILDNSEEKTEQVYSLHNQLIELLGKENIFQAELTEDRRPERSWVKNFGAPHVPALQPQISNYIPERATYLCKKPIRVEITAGYLHIQKKRYRILHWDNNLERISGGWFENPKEDIQNTFERNYFHVIIEGHQKLTIFETASREFYLHGYYG